LDFEIWIFLNYLWPDFDVALGVAGGIVFCFDFTKTPACRQDNAHKMQYKENYLQILMVMIIV